MRKIFGATDTGLVRKTNQDRFVCESISDTLAFAVLCDGMGGENGGNVASEIASQHAAAVLRRDLNGELNELSLRAILLSTVSGANALVHDAAKQDESLTGMGTTIILTVLLGDSVYIACVGDSRVYCASQERETQLTKDHTIVQMLVDIGEITPEDAKTHPKRHFITRAVGVMPEVDADFIVHKLQEGDIVLMCSDGLYGYLQPGELYGILNRCVHENSAGELIELAKAGGGIDNITAVVCG